MYKLEVQDLHKRYGSHEVLKGVSLKAAAGDVISIIGSSGFGPAKGSVLFDQDAGTFTYTPAANANGTDTFTIVITDESGGTTEQVVTVNVTPVNDAPAVTVDATTLVYASGQVVIDPALTVLRVDDVDSAATLGQGQGRGQAGDAGTDRVGGGHDGLHLLQVVDVKCRQTVAVFSGVVQQLTHRYECHG